MEYGYRVYIVLDTICNMDIEHMYMVFDTQLDHGYRAYIVLDTLWNMDIEYVYSLYTGNFGNSYL